MYQLEILTDALLVKSPHLLKSIAKLHSPALRNTSISVTSRNLSVCQKKSYWTPGMWEPGRGMILIHWKAKDEVAAVTILNNAFIDTGFANATVAHLLVGETRMNMSRKLMRKVEEVAKAAAKTLIVVFSLLPHHTIFDGRLL